MKPAAFQQELTTERGLLTDSDVTHKNLIAGTHLCTKNEDTALSPDCAIFEPLYITNYAILTTCLHAAFIDCA